MKTIIIIAILIGCLLTTSCGNLRDVNNPTGVKQVLWHKDKVDNKFYLNRIFEVTKEYYKSVKVGDDIKLTKKNYIPKLK